MCRFAELDYLVEDIYCYSEFHAPCGEIPLEERIRLATNHISACHATTHCSVLYSKKHSLSHVDSETAFSTPSTVKSVFIARIRVFYLFIFYFAIHTTNKAVLIFRAWIPLRLTSPTRLF